MQSTERGNGVQVTTSNEEATEPRTASKRPEENIDQFALRLRHLAGTCKFTDIDDQILRRVIAGSDMESFQAKCFRTDDLDLTLEAPKFQTTRSTLTIFS
ncbi:hypothetical protein BpHYR1_041237 [Brachionus plicatilis]|uniref:Uncharacterized protein n=1 Tax=Brachionus plicatilis TaxID=10195 RepID=A0A3M7PLI2_BRAPC|nr:hypothetical protein BpHYR1_041237 [Brachionus plicatilis]